MEGKVVTEKQKYWDEVIEGEELPSFDFPLSVYRLVMEAGANRDFNSIHHNSDYAKKSGAPEMYANNFFLQGMWEKVVRAYIGNQGVFKSLKKFRMNSFNIVGDTVITKGVVKKKWKDKNEFFVEIEMWSENSRGISVGPGKVVVTLPKNRREFKL